MIKKNIITQRLCICPMGESYIDDIIEIITNDTVKKTYMLPDFQDRESAEKLARRLCELSENEAHYVVGVCLGDKLIGFINDTEITPDRKSLELGWAFNPRFYNKGYATEAVSKMIEFLFTEGFAEVTAGAFEENPASMRVMEKSGMLRVPKTESIEYRGKAHNCLFYSIKRK